MKRARRESTVSKPKKLEKLDLRKFKFEKVLNKTNSNITLLGHFGKDLDKKAILTMKKVAWNSEWVEKLSWTRTADGVQSLS